MLEREGEREKVWALMALAFRARESKSSRLKSRWKGMGPESRWASDALLMVGWVVRAFSSYGMPDPEDCYCYYFEIWSGDLTYT